LIYRQLHVFYFSLDECDNTIIAVIFDNIGRDFDDGRALNTDNLFLIFTLHKEIKRLKKKSTFLAPALAANKQSIPVPLPTSRIVLPKFQEVTIIYDSKNYSSNNED
jgi:hypothetical protein